MFEFIRRRTRSRLWIIIVVTIILLFFVLAHYPQQLFRKFPWNTLNFSDAPKLRILSYACDNNVTLGEILITILDCQANYVEHASNDLSVIQDIGCNRTTVQKISETKLKYFQSQAFLKLYALNNASNHSLTLHSLDPFTYFVRTSVLDTSAHPYDNSRYFYVLNSPIVHETQASFGDFTVNNNGSPTAGILNSFVAGFFVLQNAVAQSSDGNTIIRTCTNTITISGCSSSDPQIRMKSRFPSQTNTDSYCRKKRSTVPVNIVSFKKLAILAHTWFDSFYHFTAEAVSRLMLIHELVLLDPEIHILLPYPMYRSSVTQLLHLLNIEERRIFYYDNLIESATLFYADIMLVPRGVSCGGAPPSLLDQIHRKVINFGRHENGYPKPHLLPIPIIDLKSGNKINSHFTVSKVNNGPIVIISRKKEHERHIINEADIFTYIHQHYPTIPTVSFDSTESLIETIKLFRSARVVIAPHGAGLVHLLWMRLGTAILEIFPAHTYNGCYQSMALHRGIQGFIYFDVKKRQNLSIKINMTIFGQLFERMIMSRL